MPRSFPVLRATALVALLVTGCASVSTRARHSPHGRANEETGPQAPLSLFAADTATLPDGEIARILDVRPALRDRLRIGVLHLEHQSIDFGWHRREAVPATWLHEKLFANLRGAAVVHDASYLPPFLMPPKITVGHLREAAARYQADLLLIFRTDCRTNEDVRLFRPSRARAQCLADAGLLDVRTGLILASSRAIQQFLIDKDDSDLDLGETVRRAEQKAVEAAMADNGANLATFLKSMRPRPVL